ncbi:hypothetical protein ACROYT_G000647 [Oculina patagonica]
MDCTPIRFSSKRTLQVKQMRKTSATKSLTFVGLTQLVLVWWFVASGLCCLKDVHPGNCFCKPFGPTRITVKCQGIKQVPRDLPSNTVVLNLSGNHLSSIQDDVFKNLTLLRVIDLSRNSLKFIPHSTFRNPTQILDENSIKGGFYLPESVTRVTIKYNMLLLDDLKIIVGGSKRINVLDIEGNPIGPFLTSDTFAGFDEMTYLCLANCSLKHIESGTFRRMKKLKLLDLRDNMLSHIEPGTLEGTSDNLKHLLLQHNALTSIADGTFTRFSKLTDLYLDNNNLTSAPNLTGLTQVTHLALANNQIKDISLLGISKLKQVTDLSLKFNHLEHLPVSIFQNIFVVSNLDMSFNKLLSIPNEAFSGCKKLAMLLLNFNFISQISNRTLAGLKNLRILMMINNSLAFIPEGTFADNPLLKLLFLHSNTIKLIDGNAFHGLTGLRTLTLFDNPLRSLPVTMFNKMGSNVTLTVSCKNFQELYPGIYTAFIKCAPSASFHIVIDKGESGFADGLSYSGFRCKYNPESYYSRYNCSICMTGTKSNLADFCVKCPAGGFYQDEMGRIDCKRCSTGTYVPEKDHPGKSATDCRACPYGTRSNETAGYRACKCLNNFYRFDRFGPCTACPDYGLKCHEDTAILAPNYFWKWRNTTMEEDYSKFVENIHTPGPEYNKNFSTFQRPLPKPLKCPYPGSCKGGITSACNVGYEGTLCATCSYNHYLRFNSCLQCPKIIVTIISCVVVILAFALIFVMIFLGDSVKVRRRIEEDGSSTENARPRTVADVIMSCAKIVIGFYQVVVGIFSALVRVRWPAILISMEKYLKFVEGNILQFAPLSCIHPALELDPFLQFVLTIVINISIVSLIFLYLFLKKWYINRMEEEEEKQEKISNLKRSCYRNIFLFLLLSYPMTSKKIIDILPLPGVCLDICYTKDRTDCVSLLKADYSIHCFKSRHNVFWHIAAAFALYPVLFPLLLLFPIYKYREKNPDRNPSEIAFGLRVFFENYKEKYWFWEIVEMKRKLILISIIPLFGSESRSQIGIAVIVASGSGIVYTIFRPIKGKFEDRLQTFVLWIIFFDVCLGAIYAQPDVSRSQEKNKSVVVNVVFLVLNSAVLILAFGKGLLHLWSSWQAISSCLVRCCDNEGRPIRPMYIQMQSFDEEFYVQD